MLRKLPLAAAIALTLSAATATAATARVFKPLTGNIVNDLGLPKPTGNPVEDVKTAIDTVAVNLLTKIYDKLHKDGGAAIADANRALTVASQTLSDGTTADSANQSCLKAIIPVLQIVVNNAVQGTGAVATVAAGTAPATPVPATPEDAVTAGTIDGPITVFAKLRVMIQALQSPSVQKGCAELQVQTGNTGLSGTAALVAGFVGLKPLTPLAPAALTTLGL